MGFASFAARRARAHPTGPVSDTKSFARARRAVQPSAERRRPPPRGALLPSSRLLV